MPPRLPPPSNTAWYSALSGDRLDSVGQCFQFRFAFFFHHITSPFTVLVLINASMYKPNIHSHTIPLCPSQTTKTCCLVVSVGALLPLPFDLAMSTLITLSHFVPHEQPRLVVWLFWWEHCCPSLLTWRYSSCLCTPPPTGQVTIFARSRSEGRRSWMSQDDSSCCST